MKVSCVYGRKKSARVSLFKQSPLSSFLSCCSFVTLFETVSRWEARTSAICAHSLFFVSVADSAICTCTSSIYIKLHGNTIVDLRANCQVKQKAQNNICSSHCKEWVSFVDFCCNIYQYFLHKSSLVLTRYPEPANQNSSHCVITTPSRHCKMLLNS
jgi:hypothetical protein